MLLSMRDGRSNPGGRPRIVCEKEASALVDGEGGPGQPALLFAADLAVKKAKKAGCCAVGVRNCCDVFLLGYYGERIAREDLAGIVMTTGTPLAHPGGGADRLIGTNPLVIAIPAPGKSLVLLDFATSALASGTIVEALAHGEELCPRGWRSGRTACRPGIQPPPRGRTRPWEATRATAWAWDFSQAPWWGQRWAGPPSTRAMSPRAEKEDT